jgi:hypothetical protein
MDCSIRKGCFAALLSIGLFACSSDEAEVTQDNSAQISAPDALDTIDQQIAPLSEADRRRVCRAAIADLNGHSPEIVSVTSATDDSIVVSYVRPDDGKEWTNECRFEGNRVIWRTIGAFGGSDPGRWRDAPLDEVITFTVQDASVTITTTYSDGSSGSEPYTVN